MELRLNAAALIVGALLGLVSSSSSSSTISSSDSSNDCVGQLGPPAGSITKPQVTWRMESFSTGVMKFVVSRYVAYSSTLKYVSLAFATSNKMPSTDLIVDCCEKSFGLQIGTSRNVNYTNIPDSSLSSRIWNITARKESTNLTCSFALKMQQNATFIFLAAGPMSGGLKGQHAEKYIFSTLANQCWPEPIAPSTTFSTAPATRSPSMTASTAVRAATNQSSLSGLRSTGTSPMTARVLTTNTLPKAGDIRGSDYAATTVAVDPADSWDGETVPKASAEATRRLDTSEGAATSAGSRSPSAIFSTRARSPDASKAVVGTTAAALIGETTQNSQSPESPSSGAQVQLANNMASSDGNRTPRLFYVVACLCGALVPRLEGGALPAALRL